MDFDTDPIYTGIAGITLEVETFDLGKGIVISKTFAHLMSPFLIAFSPPKTLGQHHPAPWKPVHGGMGTDREAIRLTGREAEIRAELRNARQEAEKDTSNLELLKTLFLDCLLRSKLHGFLADDFVEIKSPNFLPEVHGRNTGDFVNTSFANLGSGGKKTFFKCCFAVAVHRLAARVGGLLPDIMIIDSPMKNISERENPDQFAGFHEMLHDMAETELKGTQFIVIDKEIFRPKAGISIQFQERHMKPDDAANPPLIRNYRGK